MSNQSWTRSDARLPWPPDVYLQGGSSGIVFSRSGSYRTAFVEALAKDGFIRGEGTTVEEAEDDAFSQFVRQTTCDRTVGHDFERRNYTNGAGVCKYCAAFRSGVFDELPPDPNTPPSLLEELLTALLKVAKEGDVEDLPRS